MTLEALPPVTLTALHYTPSAFAYKRRRTHAVMVGDVGVGGDNPIRVQSMTTTRTQDVDATVAQAERLVQAGCEIVRITAPTVQDAKSIGEIRRQLRSRGIAVPLVADIHFSPAAALEAANHGSLSDRIMNRFGDTPLGMVESALEFLHICQKNGYPDVILSMKASNPKVMIQAYRLLAARMDEIGMTFPLHLGVTEAGNDEDGRIKSAVGIGSLLDDGLGDPIRVSLTEEPEAEIPVAVRLAAPYHAAAERRFLSAPDPRETRDPY